jgi:hypothetical protein
VDLNDASQLTLGSIRFRDPSPDLGRCDGTLRGEESLRHLLQPSQSRSSSEPPQDIPSPSDSHRNARNDLPTALTLTSSASSIISFGSLDSVQANLVLERENDGHTQQQDSAEGSASMSALPSSSGKSACPYVQHKYLFFDDGNITFLVRPMHPTLAPTDLEEHLYRLRASFIASIVISSAEIRVYSGNASHDFPHRRGLRLRVSFLWMV